MKPAITALYHDFVIISTREGEKITDCVQTINSFHAVNQPEHNIRYHHTQISPSDTWRLCVGSRHKLRTPLTVGVEVDYHRKPRRKRHSALLSPFPLLSGRHFFRLSENHSSALTEFHSNKPSSGSLQVGEGKEKRGPRKGVWEANKKPHPAITL